MNEKFFVRVHPLCAPGLLLLCVLNPPRIVLCMGLCVLWHEAGHLLLCLIQRRRVYGLFIEPLGLRLCAETVSFSYPQDLRLHLAGPAASFLAALSAFAAIRCAPHALWFFLFYFNGFLCLFQLIPVSGSDGANALYAFLCRTHDVARVNRIVKRVSRLCGLCVTVVLAFLTYQTGFQLSMCLIFISFALLLLRDVLKKETA